MTAEAGERWRSADLRGRTLFVGTPMYDGRCESEFTFAMVQLSALCGQLGIALHCFFACHEALIGRARNATVAAFLRSGCDHLMFIDSDIGFDPRDVIELLAMQVGGEGAAFDILAAPYPLKRMDWAQIRRAAAAGIADGDPARLARVASPVLMFPVKPGDHALDRPMEVTQAGTGFMLIRRATFERLQRLRPFPVYRSTGLGIEQGTADRIVAFFDTAADPGQKELLARARDLVEEDPSASARDVIAALTDAAAGQVHDTPTDDYAFCRAVRAAGLRVWLCPWMELSHTGSHRFVTRLADLAAIG